MQTTAHILERTAYLIHHSGLHTGHQFADATDAYGALDVCAAVYAVAEGDIPDAFYEDEIDSIRLIESSARAMAAIQAISHALDSAVCEDEVAPGVYVPNYIEHVSNWAATPPIGAAEPPTTSEVIGRILRAAQAADQRTAA
jgi:diadenosine tetraphosphatase ApaH/serine/threonine PP2A family protein phosphatase